MNTEFNNFINEQAEDKEFYLRKNNQQYGPYSEQEVIDLLSQQQFTLNNLACVKGMDDWKSLGALFRERPTSDFVRQTIGLEAWEREQVQSASLQTQYQGVGGWLLLFCVGLTILSPLLNLAAIGQTMDAVRLVGTSFPNFATVAYIEIALILGMIVFSIYTGVALWAIRPKAVTTAKIYLCCVVVVAFFDLLLVSSLDLPGAASSEARGAAISGIVRSIIYAGIWMAYLNNSKRVEATYYNIA